MFQLAIGTTTVIDRHDPALHAWLSDMEFVDTAVPSDEAHVLVFETTELTRADVLRARIATRHQEN